MVLSDMENLDSLGSELVDYHHTYHHYNAHDWQVSFDLHQSFIANSLAAFSIIAIYQTTTSTSFGAVGVDYATALYSSTLATTIFCTCAIIYRIIQVSKNSGTNLRTYRGVVEILVESSSAPQPAQNGLHS